MGANNFAFDNVLAVVPDFDLENRCMDEGCHNFEGEDETACEHGGGYYDFDTEGFNMFIDEVRANLVKVGFEEKTGSDNNRNYTGNYIAEKTIYNSKEEIYKTIIVLWRAGYYNGANIDYIIEDEGEANETKFLENKLKVNERKAKKVILKHCTELSQLGTMSNGEAVYKLKK